MRWIFGLWLLPALAFAQPEDVALPPDLEAACREAIPSALRESDDWTIHATDLDGAAPAEALLVLHAPGEAAQALFFARRENGEVERKKISFKHKPASLTIHFPNFAEGRRLVHADAGPAGQKLLFWNGKKLEKVWELGTPRAGEKVWFELEDLDDDGALEVIVYLRREVDVFLEDEFEETSAGADEVQAANQVDALEVRRFHDGRWKKNGDLLKTLR